MTTNKILIFSSPKPFNGHNAIIQDNALDSWARLPNTKVLLFGNDQGVTEAAADRGFQHIPQVACSSYGTPLLNDMFATAQAVAETGVVCYVNADIILPPDFTDIIIELNRLLPAYLAIGQRWNMDIAERIDFSSELAFSNLETIRKTSGKLYRPTGKDFFIFPCGLVKDMPAFCIGRPCWDDWMIWQAKQDNIPVVDVTGVLTVYHQSHDYHHVPERKSENWRGSPEANMNAQLVASLHDYNSEKLTIYHADYMLTLTGLAPAPYMRRVVRDFNKYYYPETIKKIRTFLRPLKRALHKVMLN